MPRDVPGWYPAVVLEVGEQDARIGIEGVENDGDGHWIPAEDVTWARKRNADGSLSKKAKSAGDLVSRTQRTTGIILDYMTKMGVSPSIMQAMTASKDIRWLTEKEAFEMNLVTARYAGS